MRNASDVRMNRDRHHARFDRLTEPIKPVDSSTLELIRGLTLQREDCDVIHTARDSADFSG